MPCLRARACPQARRSGVLISKDAYVTSPGKASSQFAPLAQHLYLLEIRNHDLLFELYI